MVERASVEGRLFHRGSVVELAPADVRRDVGAHLLALVRKEFVRPDRAQLVGDDGYRFAHALIRDAAYESMSKELRAELHERLVDWLERVASDRLGELDEIVAYHLEQAARYRRELDLPDEREAGRRAAELLVRSGTRAYDRGDLSAARTSSVERWRCWRRRPATRSSPDPTRSRDLRCRGRHGACRAPRSGARRESDRG